MLLNEAVNITGCSCKRIKSRCHSLIFAESVQRTSSDTPIPLAPAGHERQCLVFSFGLDNSRRSTMQWHAIAFLAIDQEIETPFARTLRVIDTAPVKRERFAARLG